MHHILLVIHQYCDCLVQRDFTVRIQSATPLSVSDVSASNGEVMSVTPVSGRTGSYDVAVAAKKSGVVAVSTLAAASTIDVNVDTDEPKVRGVDLASVLSLSLLLLTPRDAQYTHSSL